MAGYLSRLTRDRERFTLLSLAAAGRRALDEILRRVSVRRGATSGLGRRATAGSGKEGEVPHASALPNGSIGEPHPEELDATVRARPGVVAIVAAVGAAPRHLPGARRVLLLCLRSSISESPRRSQGGKLGLELGIRSHRTGRSGIGGSRGRRSASGLRKRQRRGTRKFWKWDKEQKYFYTRSTFTRITSLTFPGCG
ncbi:hypothetical protein GW17_00048296 [Ensete ventricosum]|nr:hypothetical protein GW17_00048296 [Ensete ventricosum]